MAGDGVGLGEVQQGFEGVGQFDAFVREVFAQVAGYFGFAVEGGEAVDEAKELHSQAGVFQGPG